MQRFLELGIHSHDDLVPAVVDDSILNGREENAIRTINNFVFNGLICSQMNNLRDDLVKVTNIQVSNDLMGVELGADSAIELL